MMKAASRTSKVLKLETQERSCGAATNGCENKKIQL